MPQLAARRSTAARRQRRRNDSALPARPSPSDGRNDSALPARTSRSDGRNELAAEYGPYIRRIAYRLARRLPSEVQVDDLISAGYMGLLDAIDRFDPRRAERLDQFAEYRVRGAMLDELRALDPLGRDTRARANKLRDTLRTLAQKHGRAPEEKEVARAMGMDLTSYRRLVQDVAHSRSVSLDHLTDEGGRVPADTHTPDPAELAELAETREQLAGALAALPDRHRLVLTLYYYEDLNLREIGEVLEVTESRVCQMHAEAVKRLRSILTERAFVEAAA